MSDIYEIHPSRKVALNNTKQYMVTRERFVCLRILGDGSSFEIMTATASEDNRRFVVVPNQELLMEVAQKTAEALGVKPSMHLDNYGRAYVKISRVFSDAEVDQVIDTFGHLVEQSLIEDGPAQGEAHSELHEIYDAVAPDDSGEDAYLGDGVWISRDGSLSDRGR